MYSSLHVIYIVTLVLLLTCNKEKNSENGSKIYTVHIILKISYRFKVFLAACPLRAILLARKI